MLQLGGSALTQERPDDLNYLSRTLRDINPCEANDSPAVDQRLSIAFPISGERIGQFVPPPRVPFNRQPFHRECGIETAIEIPGNRELEPRFRQTAGLKHLCSPQLKRRAVGRTGLPLLKD